MHVLCAPGAVAGSANAVGMAHKLVPCQPALLRDVPVKPTQTECTTMPKSEKEHKKCSLSNKKTFFQMRFLGCKDGKVNKKQFVNLPR